MKTILFVIMTFLSSSLWAASVTFGVASDSMGNRVVGPAGYVSLDLEHLSLSSTSVRSARQITSLMAQYEYTIDRFSLTPRIGLTTGITPYPSVDKAPCFGKDIRYQWCGSLGFGTTFKITNYVGISVNFMPGVNSIGVRLYDFSR